MGQVAFADKFVSSWRGSKFTRIEMNSLATVPGGIAADNNCLEAKNGAHKGYSGRHNVGRGLPQAQKYIGEMAKWVENCSINSTEFGELLNSDVHCMFHYNAVWKMWQAEISPLTIVFPQRGGRQTGIVIIASQFTLNSVRAEATMTVQGGANQMTVAEYKEEVKERLKNFKAMVKNNTGVEPLDFDELCGVNKKDHIAGRARDFYYLTPIVDEPYLLNLFSRLLNSGLQLIDFEALQERGRVGIMSCSCSKFLHRAWCIHSCVDAMKKGIITGFSSQMDPSSSDLRSGRPTERQVVGLERHVLCGLTK